MAAEERTITAWHEAGHALIFSSLDVPCSARIFSDEVGQVCPLNSETPINAGLLMIVPFGGVLGELLLKAHRGQSELNEEALLVAWKELNKRADLHDDRRSLIREINHVYGVQTTATASQVFALIRIFCEHVGFSSDGRAAIAEIASLLETNDEVQLVCEGGQYRAVIVIPETPMRDEMQFPYDQTDKFLERIQARIESPLTWVSNLQTSSQLEEKD